MSSRINLASTNPHLVEFRSSFELNYMLCSRLIGGYCGIGISKWTNYRTEPLEGLPEVDLDLSFGISKLLTNRTGLSLGISIIDSSLESYDIFFNSRLNSNLTIIYGGSLTSLKPAAQIGVGYTF